MLYWCKLFDSCGRVISAERSECHDDDAAIIFMRAIQAADSSHGFEIWNGKRLVHRQRERRAAIPSPPPQDAHAATDVKLDAGSVIRR